MNCQSQRNEGEKKHVVFNLVSKQSGVHQTQWQAAAVQLTSLSKPPGEQEILPAFFWSVRQHWFEVALQHKHERYYAWVRLLQKLCIFVQF